MRSVRKVELWSLWMCCDSVGLKGCVELKATLCDWEEAYGAMCVLLLDLMLMRLTGAFLRPMFENSLKVLVLYVWYGGSCASSCSKSYESRFSSDWYIFSGVIIFSLRKQFWPYAGKWPRPDYDSYLRDLEIDSDSFPVNRGTNRFKLVFDANRWSGEMSPKSLLSTFCLLGRLRFLGELFSVATCRCSTERYRL